MDWQNVFIILVGLVLLWMWSGFKKWPIGWKWQLLLLGKRLPIVFGEGWGWAAFPFGQQGADCRFKSVVLETTKLFTKDGVEVEIRTPKVLKRIKDLGKYLDLDPAAEQALMDELLDQSVRAQVRTNDFAIATDKKFEPDDNVKNKFDKYGIEVAEITVPEIVPADNEFARAFELLSKEKFERKGQAEEADHIVALTTKFRTAGMSPARAEEMAGLVSRRVSSKTVQGFSFDFDADTVNAVANALRSLGGRS